MIHSRNWSCIIFWLLVALFAAKARVNGKETTVDETTSILTTDPTLPDPILRYAAASSQPPSKRRRRTTPRFTTTESNTPLRLTDPPSTSPRPTSPPATPLRLTDPPTPSTEPETTTCKLSITPVVLEPRKVKSPESIRKDCQNFSIIPDLLDANDTVPHPMQVRFLFEHVARYGNTIHPKHMVFRPYYVTWENNKTDFYTLLMLDIDYPSRSNPYMRSYLHWQVLNIKGEAWIKAETWAEYIGPNPLYGSGLHRYLFFVLKQPSQIHFTELKYPALYLDEHRANFSLQTFWKKYDLKLHAMNFLSSECTDHQFSHAEPHLNRTLDLIPRAL
nr:PREDICTED: uncharacterized protein LOC109036198 [Bemisia tabaci]